MHMRDLVNREDGREESKALLILQAFKRDRSITQIADFLGISIQEVTDVAKKYGVTLLQYE